jgi:hypothetical protein
MLSVRTTATSYRSIKVELQDKHCNTFMILTVKIRVKQDLIVDCKYVSSRCIPSTQLFITGLHPRAFLSIQTIPQRDTVAGVAADKSGTSKINFMVGEIGIRSPLVKKSILLESIAVFILSIHKESTGPSKTIHFLFGDVLAETVRIKWDRIPSVQFSAASVKP